MDTRHFRLIVSLGLMTAWLGAVGGLGGCTTRPGEPLARQGDEIVVCGQLFHTGAPVVLWTDPGGYDAYRVEKRFVPWEQASWAAMTKENKAPESPARYGMRTAGLSPEEIGKFRGGGWDLPSLQKKVDQFVLHYDVCGTSRQCFKVLHDSRNLSVHFMLDVDGTIYQTLDLKERAWHATSSNDRSVGIEIANIGAYQAKDVKTLDQWYARGADGTVRLKLPDWMGDGGIRTQGFLGVGHPDRNEMVVGTVQGTVLHQYDLTPQQYDSLIKLTAALCTVLPEIRCDYPRDDYGNLVTNALVGESLTKYKGVMGHFHVQKNKTDPGPAMQWDRVIGEARKSMGLSAARAGAEKAPAKWSAMGIPDNRMGVEPTEKKE